MSLFSRRRPATSAPTDPPLADPPLAAFAYDAWRTARPEVPSLRTAHWVGFGYPSEVVAGGAATGLLDGFRVDIAQTTDPAIPFATVVSEAPGTFWGIVECHDAGHALAYTVLRHHDGTTSRHGPGPMPADANAWGNLTLDIISALLARQALGAAGVPIADERVRAHSSPALLQFAAAGPVPAIESWNVVETIGTAPDCRIEIWANTIDARLGEHTPYRTPLVAAAFGSSGQIVAMLAVETMPDVHDDAYAIIFDGRQRMNLGSRRDVLEPASFRSFAMEMLGSCA